MNEHIAYLAGFFCLRGKVVWDKAAGNYTMGLQTNDREMALLLAGRIKAAFGEPRVYEKDGLYVVVFHGKEEVKQLLGMAGSSGFGEYDWSVPSGLIEDMWFGKAFLQGAFDAGGNIRIEKRTGGKRRDIRINSVNKAGLLSLKQMLSTFGIGANVYKTGRAFCLSIEGKTRCNLFMQKIGFAHPNKIEKMKGVLGF